MKTKSIIKNSLQYLLGAVLVAFTSCSGSGDITPEHYYDTPRRKTDPIKCKNDFDCPQKLPCGPCDNGDVIKIFNLHKMCFYNPCSHVIGVCSNGICIISDGSL